LFSIFIDNYEKTLLAQYKQGLDGNVDRTLLLMLRVALLLVLALLAWVYWPATGADFVIDDYVFIATARMVDNPLPAFWQSHFYEPYYFRPFGILSWWVITRIFSLDYQAHSIVNLAIHALSACLLASLLRELGAKKWATLAAAALFALAPFSLTATLWPSNRFDLLAVLFLFCAAISLLKVLRGGTMRWWVALGFSALAACWSKELAFPAATMMALTGLFYSGATPRLRIAAFAMLGATISVAFFWRHAVIAQPYAVTSADPITRFLEGGQAWANAVPGFAALALSESNVSIASWVVVGALVLAVLFPVRRLQRRFGDAPAPLMPSAAMLVAAVLVWAVISLVQMPLAGAFVGMLDGDALGTITFGRFYYGAMAALAVVAGAVLSRARMTAALSVAVIVCAVVLGAQQRTTAESFARWTQSDIRPVAIAASARVDANASAKPDSPCVFVFLGTQANHPWFRMFSDVTVKARTEVPANAWRCHVLTESTPWIFAFPLGVSPADLGLPSVPDVGGPKADSTWGTIRYRYRLAPKDVQVLAGARFFDWRADKFVEVTEEARSGTRQVKTHGWGF
jgi:hypothetical protein